MPGRLTKPILSSESIAQHHPAQRHSRGIFEGIFELRFKTKLAQFALEARDIQLADGPKTCEHWAKVNREYQEEIKKIGDLFQ